MTGNRRLKLTFFTFILCWGAAFAQGNSKFRVVLDPGHGAKDYGAVYHGFIEKNIALNVALKVGKILEKDPGVQVIYTRKTDVFIELGERCNIANRADANVFVSIHCNGESKKTAYGTEAFVIGTTKNASNLEVAKKENAVISLEDDYKVKYAGYDPNRPESMIGLMLQQEEYINQSIDLASKVEENFTDDLKRKKRGVKQAPFLVLHKTAMPSILIELGFLSYQPEGEYLNSEAGQDELAESIAKAILSYKKEYFIPGTVDYKEPAVADEPKTTPKTEKPVSKPAAEKPVAKPVADNATASSTKGQSFRVQIAASGNDLETVPSNFKGLGNITKEKSASVIKYFYGETTDREQAKTLLAEAKAKGYTSAFIATFKDGKKVN
ncbi:N-acetylmuramoyl-L-alanine amidase [Flavobacterium album]|uniref:N-acetylmuramoyl-L-alanine amidase n=2 Tax=Flavobacterium album TaxID=2175091 RepID=A0A2S1R2U8_9FLAO|nr:N-acetylmuramoyl-L-alanine amidase [Flavobacterium album]